MNQKELNLSKVYDRLCDILDVPLEYRDDPRELIIAATFLRDDIDKVCELLNGAPLRSINQVPQSLIEEENLRLRKEIESLRASGDSPAQDRKEFRYPVKEEEDSHA